MHEKKVGYGLRGSGLTGSGRPFVSLLSRLASGLVFCCLASTCIFLPWPLCSWVLVCRMLGLPWAFFGPLPGLSSPEGHFGAPGGPWAPGPSWASPGLLLGSPLAGPWGPWVILGGSWASLGSSWAAPGLSGATLAASWASFGASWAALGR